MPTAVALASKTASSAAAPCSTPAPAPCPDGSQKSTGAPFAPSMRRASLVRTSFSPLSRTAMRIKRHTVGISAAPRQLKTRAARLIAPTPTKPAVPFAMSLLPLICRALCGCVFLIAGAAKCIRFQAFHRAITAYRLVPREFVSWVGIAVFLLELLIGATLLAGYETTLAAAAGLLLLSIFTAASTVVRGLGPTPCGCFGLRRSSRIGPKLFARNLSLAAALLVCVIGNRPWTGAVLVLSTAGAVAIVLCGRRRAARTPKPGLGPKPCPNCGSPARLEPHALGQIAAGPPATARSNPLRAAAPERQ